MKLNESHNKEPIKKKECLTSHPLPNPDEMVFKVIIKALRTDKKNKNCLSLGRNIIKVLELDYKIKKENILRSGANVNQDYLEATAGLIFRCLIDGTNQLYRNIDVNSIEGTNGIWQVSFFIKSFKTYFK